MATTGRQYRDYADQVFSRLERRLPVSWTLIAPAALLLLLVTALPIVYLIWLSFTDFHILRGVSGFVGIDNYISAVVYSSGFRSAILTTGVFIVAAVSVQTVSGFLLALLLWDRPKRRKYFLPVLLMPMFITWIAVGLMFRFIFESGLGIIPHLLAMVGIEIAWFSHPTYALAAIVISDIWEWVPFMMILFLAGLESLPEDPHEAARVDGATNWEVFKDVTLPMMYPVIGVAVFIRLIEASKVFPKVLAMTEGGPGTSTETVSWTIYKVGFRFDELAMAASQAVTITLMVLGLLWVFAWAGGVKDAF